MTRSPSWDEHISFSRVPWPTSRHQVNTLFQFQHSNSLTNWPRGLLNGSGLKFILQELVLLHKVTLTVDEFLHQWHITQVTHTSPADVLMDIFKMSIIKTIKETKISHSVSHAMFIYNHRIISQIMNTYSALLVWHFYLIFESFVQSAFTNVCSLVKTLLMQCHIHFLSHAEIPFHYLFMFSPIEKKFVSDCLTWNMTSVFCVNNLEKDLVLTDTNQKKVNLIFGFKLYLLIQFISCWPHFEANSSTY